MALNGEQHGTVGDPPQAHFACRRPDHKERTVGAEDDRHPIVERLGEHRFGYVGARQIGIPSVHILQVDLAKAQAGEIEAIQIAAQKA